MGKKYKITFLACDFETTVYDGQTETLVWSAASTKLYDESNKVEIQGCIEDFIKYIFSIPETVICYFHNLKFDGSFIVDYLLRNDYKQALTDNKWMETKEMPRKSFKYLISDMGQWYSIHIKDNNGKTIEIRDSLKLLPFSLREIAKGFNTPHKKLEMEYKGFRFPNCTISPTEREYIENDVLVLKEALEIMFNNGHNKLTIGSCCLQEFKLSLGLPKYDYERVFPDMYQIEISMERFGVQTVGDFCRHAYKGAWCYLKRGCENKKFTLGCTNDVNSLYPSMMHSESGNYYPYGNPTLWNGNYIPKEALINNRFYFLKVTTRFKLKPNKLPCIQVKHDKRYKSNEWLETSDVYYKGKYYPQLYDNNNNLIDMKVTMYLTMIDWELINQQYDLIDPVIECGMWFEAQKGIFDTYINKYREIKMNSKGAKRTEAKLFLNYLYGKMATSPDSDYKIAFINDKDTISFDTVEAHDKKAGYIPVGAAITAYARRFTITAAQANYDTFIYADTDSIHCNCKPSEVKGITVHPSAFCCWKTESTWDEGIFVRQKTYIEHVIEEDCEKCEPYYNVKSAGLPKKSNWLLNKSLDYNRTGKLDITENERIQYSLKPENIEWIKQKRTTEDFKVGMTIPCALKQKRIYGGVILYEKDYVMR